MTKQAAPSQDFTNFPPVPEGHTRVFLNHSWGQTRGRLYGPGWAHIPDHLLATVEAQPDLVRTNLTGTPDVNTVAASVASGSTATGLASSTGIPHPERDDDDDAAITDADAPVDHAAARSAAIADAADGDRSGGETIGETGSHLNTSRVLTPQPGLHVTPPEHSAALATEAARSGKTSNTNSTTGATPTSSSSSTTTTSSDETGPKPATKSALKRVGVEDLRVLAAEKGVKIKDDDDKDAVIEKLYDAHVSLDD